MLQQDVRLIFSWENKPLGIPNAQSYCPDTLYIRALWMRIGGVLGGVKQEDVANYLGTSLATLKRYMLNEGSCPYSIQFSLESLAGMTGAGKLYPIRSNEIVCQALLPYAASRSTNFLSRVVLTDNETVQMAEVVSRYGYSLDFGSPIETDAHAQVCPLCKEKVRPRTVDFGKRKVIDCPSCRQFVITDLVLKKREGISEWHANTWAQMSATLKPDEFLHIQVKKIDQRWEVDASPEPKSSYPSWFSD